MTTSLAMIDQHLLALSTEGEFGPDEPDRLQEILRQSLLFAQLEYRPIPDLDQDKARTLLMSRLRSIYHRVPSAVRRNQYYLMGLSLADCEKVAAARDRIVALMVQAGTWSEMDSDQRLAVVVALIEIAFTLDAASDAVKTMPANAIEIVRAWLSGERPVDMAARGLADDFDGDSGRLGRFLEEFCVYGLAWVLTGFVGFARRELEENGQTIPEVATHFPAMVKAGVPEPMAAILAPYIQQDRRLAITVASACPYSLGEVQRAIAWVNAVEPETLVEAGVEPDDASRIAARRRTLADLVAIGNENELTWRLRVARDRFLRSTVGDPVVIRVRPESGPTSFEVLSLDGESLGQYRLTQGELPEWLADWHRVEATIETVLEETAEAFHVRVKVRLLAA